MICKRICTEYASFSVEENRKDLLNLMNISCSEYPESVAQDYVLFDDGTKYKAMRRE